MELKQFLLYILYLVDSKHQYEFLDSMKDGIEKSHQKRVIDALADVENTLIKKLDNPNITKAKKLEVLKAFHEQLEKFLDYLGSSSQYLSRFNSHINPAENLYGARYKKGYAAAIHGLKEAHHKSRVTSMLVYHPLADFSYYTNQKIKLLEGTLVYEKLFAEMAEDFKDNAIFSKKYTISARNLYGQFLQLNGDFDAICKQGLSKPYFSADMKTNYLEVQERITTNLIQDADDVAGSKNILNKVKNKTKKLLTSGKINALKNTSQLKGLRRRTYYGSQHMDLFPQNSISNDLVRLFDRYGEVFFIDENANKIFMKKNKDILSHFYWKLRYSRNRVEVLHDTVGFGRETRTIPVSYLHECDLNSADWNKRRKLRLTEKDLVLKGKIAQRVGNEQIEANLRQAIFNRNFRPDASGLMHSLSNTKGLSKLLLPADVILTSLEIVSLVALGGYALAQSLGIADEEKSPSLVKYHDQLDRLERNRILLMGNKYRAVNQIALTKTNALIEAKKEEIFIFANTFLSNEIMASKTQEFMNLQSERKTLTSPIGNSDPLISHDEYCNMEYGTNKTERIAQIDKQMASLTMDFARYAAGVHRYRLEHDGSLDHYQQLVASLGNNIKR